MSGRMISLSTEPNRVDSDVHAGCGGEVLFKFSIGVDSEGRGGFWIHQCSKCKDLIVRDE